MRIEQKLIIPLIIIIIGNILTGIIKSNGLTYYILYVGIFLLFIILLLIKEIKIPIIKITSIKGNRINYRTKIINIEMNNNLFSIIMLIFSAVSMFNEDISALNDVLFFTYSIFILKRSKKIYWIYGFIYGSLLLTRYTFMDLSLSEIIVHLSGISFILVTYQHYIHPKKIIKEDIIPNYLISPVKKDIVDTVRLIILGYQYHEINDKLELSITDDQVRRNVNKEVKRLGFRNREHMIFFLTEKGIIKSISYDLDTKDKSHDSL